MNKYLTLPFVTPKAAQSSSLLPILDQTRTLLFEPKTTRHFYTCNRQVNNGNKSRRNFCSTPQKQVDTRTFRPFKQDSIVFVDPYYRKVPATPWHSQPPRPSTVTKSEQAAFDRLIKDVSQPTTPEPREDDILDLDDLLAGHDPNTDLDNIFEDAIKSLQTDKAEGSFFSDLSWKRLALDRLVSDEEPELNARTFRRPLKLVDGTMKLTDGTTLATEIENEEGRARLEVACDDHRNLVMRMLDGAKSDVEIWQVLEQEVFSLINDLNEHVKIIRRRTKNLPPAKVRKADAEGKDVADVKLEKGDLDKKESKSFKLTRTNAIPINNLLAILHRNYSEYLLHALRLYRRQHPLSSYGPLVFSTMKRRGPMSYVLGVSTDIYNEILFLQWTQFSDLYGMADTIEEMLSQGIECNGITIALIKGITRQRQMGIREFYGPVVKEWWNMPGNLEGWRNMLQLFHTILSEEAENAAKVAAEGQSEETGLRSDNISQRRTVFTASAPRLKPLSP